LRQIDRFNREALATIAASEDGASTVRTYVSQKGYGDDFLQLFLIPMSSAVWSTPPDRMLDFPAMTLLRFFHNHGFLGLSTQHPWRTVAGGAQSYVPKLTAGFRDRIKLGAAAAKVTRQGGRAQVTTVDGATGEFDKVILASHANATLAMLGDPTEAEARLLGEFHYQPNIATLHTDASCMPRTRRAWASWNYRIDREAGERTAPSTHYWMNSLQGVSKKHDYFVSINGESAIAPAKVLRRIEYEHPLFSLGAIAAQAELPALNRVAADQTTYFCGSYFKYGFHEDAFTSALECARAVTGEPIWS
jgi:predicted NAD/FAD-binding protein